MVCRSSAKPCRLNDTNRGYGGLAGLAINYSSIISPKTRGDAQSASVTVSVSDGEVGASAGSEVIHIHYTKLPR